MSVRRAAGAALAALLALALALAFALAAVPALGGPRAGASQSGAAAAATVQAMVVGRGGEVLAPARGVSAAATSVRVRGRSCGVAAGTPLTVLAALRRTGGPGFALRDYGHCGSSPSSSAQLYVYSVGGEPGSGQNGWEYKVDGYAGSTGAGDPSGVRGDGRRIRTGQRVLWFWCQASGGGCQRSLALALPSGSVAPGAALTVMVTAQDNEARSRPLAGAIVTLGSDFASTGADGRATLIAPAQARRYRLSATRAGLVPAFPQTIVVR